MYDVTLDFETFSELPIKAGVTAYASHPSTEVLVASMQVNDKPVRRWIPHKDGGRIPTELAAALKRDDSIYRAWNAGFEIAIWTHVWSRSINIPCPPVEQWIDSMALAAYFGLPQKLETAGKVTGTYKLDSGRRLINMLSMPCKPTKKFPHTRRTPETHPELFDELYTYCDGDVIADRAVQEWLPRKALPNG